MFFFKEYYKPFNDFAQSPNWFENAVETLTESAVKPNCEVGQTDTHYWLSVDLPGVAKEDISIETKGDELTISGERKGYGKFRRVFELNAPVEIDKIETLHKDGVLKVAIPKAEAAKPKTIAIKSEDEAGLFKTLLAPTKDEPKKVN